MAGSMGKVHAFDFFLQLLHFRKGFSQDVFIKGQFRDAHQAGDTNLRVFFKLSDEGLDFVYRNAAFVRFLGNVDLDEAIERIAESLSSSIAKAIRSSE